MPPATRSPDRRGRALLWFLKTALGLAVLGWLLFAVRPGRLVDAAREGDRFLLGIGLLLLASAIGAQALRLKVLAAPLGLTLVSSVEITLASYLFNQLLPGGLGGEGYRAIRLTKLTERWPATLGILGVERLLGGAALLVPAAVYYSLERERLHRLVAERTGALEWGPGSVPWLLPALGVASAVLVIAAFQSERLRAALRSAATEVARALAAIGYPRHLGAVALSLAYHLLRLLAVQLILVALGQRLPAPDVLLVLATTLVASMIPLTLGSLGVKEGAIVLTLSLFGVGEGDALVVALMNRTVLLAAAIAGLVVLLRERASRGLDARGDS